MWFIGWQGQVYTLLLTLEKRKEMGMNVFALREAALRCLCAVVCSISKKPFIYPKVAGPTGESCPLSHSFRRPWPECYWWLLISSGFENPEHGETQLHVYMCELPLRVYEGWFLWVGIMDLWLCRPIFSSTVEVTIQDATAQWLLHIDLVLVKPSTK